MQQELAVAFHAGDRRLGQCRRAAILAQAAAAVTSSTTRVLHRLVAHDAAFADLVAPGLELRLDQRDDVAAGVEAAAAAPAGSGAAR